MAQILRIRILGMIAVSIASLGGCLGEKPPTDQESPTGTSMLPVPEMLGKMQDTSKDFEEDDHFLPLPNTQWRKAVYDGVVNDLILISESREFVKFTEKEARAVLRVQSTLNRGVSRLTMTFGSDHEIPLCDYSNDEQCTVIIGLNEQEIFEAPVKLGRFGNSSVYIFAFYDTDLIYQLESYDRFDVWLDFGSEKSQYIFNIKGFSKEFLEFEPIDPALLKEIDSQ
ncbi:hypothetical protein L1281_002584 [Neisseria sp. HSC-16F19]|nr:hypothetical protein [Neisseria sp. HSC-16F19]MCP2041966.1 hypothetical protein [Neisseria sp. HSC-16F19]